MPMMSAHRISGWLLQNSCETCRAASPIVWDQMNQSETKVLVGVVRVA
jgi:hypothetical protein